MIPTHQEVYDGLLASARTSYKMAKAMGCSHEGAMSDVYERVDQELRRARQHLREARTQGGRTFRGRAMGAHMRLRSYLVRVVGENDKKEGGKGA